MKQRATRERLEPHLRDAEIAEKGLTRLTELLATLLDVGRIEQGLFEIQPVPTELVTLVHVIADAIQLPNVPISVHGAPEIVVDADPAKLKQAIENLLSNACKHSPAGRAVDVDVSACDGPDGSRHACIVVADQGPGMEAELASRVFTRFARGSRSEGLGLGLYLAREIVRAHRGTLELTTAPGRGATFTVRLPARPW